MRKYFNSTLKNAGMDSERVEFMMGHDLGDTKNAYYRADAKKLKELYGQYMAHLTIQKPLDVADSPEFRKIESENKVLMAETVKHMVERDEMADMRKQLKEIQLAIGLLQVISTADESGMTDKLISEEGSEKARKEMKADKAKRVRIMNAPVNDSMIDEVKNNG
jgi:hypothetical protein